MYFLDQLYYRYANPMQILDRVVRSRKLTKFIKTMNENINEERTFKIWLIKYSNECEYEEYLEQIKPIEVKKIDIKETLNSSYEILNKFKPEEVK